MRIHCGNIHNYTAIKTKHGYITSIFDEAGREGGYTYIRGEFGDDLQEKMNHVAYDYGKKKYIAIRISAFNENLLNWVDASGAIRKRITERIEDNINYHKEEIKKLKKELDDA